jgi:hypothetical protein
MRQAFTNAITAEDAQDVPRALMASRERCSRPSPSGNRVVAAYGVKHTTCLVSAGPPGVRDKVARRDRAAHAGATDRAALSARLSQQW